MSTRRITSRNVACPTCGVIGYLYHFPQRVSHSHVCATCSPDGMNAGPGCINCRNTGMDQTPCQAPGHVASCPVDCCAPMSDLSPLKA